MTKEEKLVLILATLISNAVEDMGVPVPEGPMYAAFQTKGIPLHVFQAAVQKAKDKKMVREGPMPYTLVKA